MAEIQLLVPLLGAVAFVALVPLRYKLLVAQGVLLLGLTGAMSDIARAVPEAGQSLRAWLGLLIVTVAVLVSLAPAWMIVGGWLRGDFVRVAGTGPSTRAATVALVAVNVGAFLWARSHQPFGELRTLSDWALSSATLVYGEHWRIVTSAFLHLETGHLLGNMLWLAFWGHLLEPIVGRGRLLALYAVSLLGGALGVVLIASPNAHMVGASGAMVGLAGGAAVVAFRRDLPMPPPLVLCLVAGEAWRAVTQMHGSGAVHFGGGIAGILAALALVERGDRGRRWLAFGLCLAMAVALFAGSVFVASHRWSRPLGGEPAGRSL